MAGKVRPTAKILTTDETAQDAIKQAVLNAINAFRVEADAIKTAQDQITQQTETARGSRAKLVCDLAVMSADNDWTTAQIETACSEAVKAWLAVDETREIKSVQTFAQECQRAMHPKAREHVVTDFDDIESDWQAEADAYANAVKARKEDKSVELPERPLAQAFARKYHAVVGSKGSCAARIADQEFSDFDDLASQRIGTAKADPKRAASALKRVVAQLEALYAEFPLKEIKNCVDYLSPLNNGKALAEAKEAQRVARLPSAKVVNAKLPAKKIAAPVADTEDATAAAMRDLLANPGVLNQLAALLTTAKAA